MSERETKDKKEKKENNKTKKNKVEKEKKVKTKKKQLLIIESSSLSSNKSLKMDKKSNSSLKEKVKKVNNKTKKNKEEKEKEKKDKKEAKEKEKKDKKEEKVKVKKVNNKTKKNKDKKENNKSKKNKVMLLERKLILEAATASPELNMGEQKREKDEEKTNIKESIQDIKMSNNNNGRLNEKYIELMDKLSEIMMKQGEPFRARAYQKAQETIMVYPDDITSPEQLKGKPNIGSTIMEKLNEYEQTGTLKVLEREKNNPVNILADVYGIGPKKAKELVAQGITSIADLRENQNKLNDVQKVGLKYYEDILKRIPRSEIDQYSSVFETAFLKASNLVDENHKNGKSRFEIVGSYRRGAENSGDIDVIITSESPKLFIQFINTLVAEKVIVEVLSRGSTKCLVITKIPGSDSYRRVDFLYTTPEEYPFSVLYFTGSKIFNTVMRSHALKMGFTMNEHGLYKMEDKKKGEKVSHNFVSEKDIFDFLNLVYKGPKERIDGRAIIVKGLEKEIKEEKEEKKEESLIFKNLEEEMKVKKAKTVKKRAIKEKVEEEEKVKKPNKKTKKNKEEQKIVIKEEEKDEEKEVKVEEKKIDENLDIKQIIMNFKKNGITVLNGLNENQLTSILREANKAYYNEQPLMTDNEYDIVKEYIEKKYPTNKAILEIGAPIERNKTVLPYQMWSMDKIKPDTNALSNWMSKYKGPYILSCKLDGVSGLYSTEGKEPKLYTRGDGKVGQDVSHLIPHLRLPKTKGIVIRGEFIIPKATFDTKYKMKFANPRNMVSGIVVGKTITESVKDLHFVTYEVIQPILKPSLQMDYIATLDVECVLYKVEKVLSNELLSETLVDWRKNYAYEIDGVIVTNDGIYERHSGNPEHAFAFKMVLSDQVAEAKVVDVIWTPSKDGYLKPRVQIEPIQLGGVKIEYATGFNGSFINDNKIGIGAVIELIRSGDVIPYIRKVVVPAEEAKMPSVPFKWNDTHIDVMLENIDSDETVREKNITGFFRGIGVEGLSSGNVTRIINAGYNTVPKIIKMTVDDFLKVEGFKMKLATKIYDGIKDKIKAATIIMLMSGSNLLGRGFSEKKMELIMDDYPNVLTSNESVEQKVNKVASIKGMAKKSAELFVDRIPAFIEFMKEANLEHKLYHDSSLGVGLGKKEYDTSHLLYGKTIVMTGFRDASLQQKIQSVGANVGSSVSKNTFVVLVKDSDVDQGSGKANEAKKLGIPIMTRDEFINKYFEG
jgi:NAD-dependent DNA ligase/DNA polymerase/3'-5' exonuclease PolX